MLIVHPGVHRELRVLSPREGDISCLFHQGTYLDVFKLQFPRWSASSNFVVQEPLWLRGMLVPLE